jgi:hypothetical protein
MAFLRFFRRYSQEYMFTWNSLVAIHTFGTLSEQRQEEVMEHYYRVLLQQFDPAQDTVPLGQYQPFWMSATFRDLGIAPKLGSKKAKWFYVTDPNSARYRSMSLTKELRTEVLRDIELQHRVILELPRK